MIELPTLLGFIAASSLLILIPGPNVVLIALQSALHGRRSGLLVVAGLTSGQAVQILLVLAGLSALLSVWSVAFTVLKVLGALYLLWLAFEAFTHTRQAVVSSEGAIIEPVRNLFLRGVLVALANPKTMLFHAAFLPQFVSVQYSVFPQLILLGSIFLCLAFFLDSLWAIAISSMRRFMQNSRVQSWLKWGTGLVYLIMGVLLFTRKSSS
ncbi:MAG: LysE family translocator [Robiginitomaculum sp.]|nr:LysE family translocator [Robiginitomaculum sp.]